jgi:hypothetical protein
MTKNLKDQLKLGAAVVATSLAGAFAFDVLTYWGTNR